MKGKPEQESTTNRIAQAVCELCNGNAGGHCGINLLLENGTIIEARGRQEHPISRGYICPKGRAIPQIIHAADRLRSPLKKTGDGLWENISWDEAINVVAERLATIKSKYGAEAVAVHVGHAGVRKEFTPFAERFCQSFGSPNFSTAGSFCYLSKLIANTVTFGVLPVADFKHSNCMIFWGYNPSESFPPLLKNANEARKQGAKLIVIDPRSIPPAKNADLHLQLRPGTDVALALGMLYVIVSEQLYNKEFVQAWTVGFDELSKRVKEYPPERVEKITWVPADKIRQAAHLYISSKPACIYPGIAVELISNGFQALRAIAILQAISGNLDVPGGAIFTAAPRLSSVAAETHIQEPAIGQDEFPLFYKYTKRAQATRYTKAILDGKPYPIKGMIITASNPVLTWPNAGKVKTALSNLDFLVVIDLFMTETARLADLVIPAATFLERDDLWDHSHVLGESKLGFAKKVIENDSCITDLLFWLKLAGKMGFNQQFPWKSEQEAINFRLQSLDLSIEKLSDYPDGYVYSDQKVKKYEQKGFNTPSGKVEIYSRELERYGYDPLPAYEMPDKNLEFSKEITDLYPLILSTGARVATYIHSRHRNLFSLQQRMPEPWVEIHKDKAKELGIEEGEIVIVETPTGSIKLKARLTTDTDPRLVFVPHGWAEANANILTDDEIVDPVSGFPSLRMLMARVRKLRD